VAVCEWYAGKVPECEEEAELFEVHVPGILLVASLRSKRFLVSRDKRVYGLTSW
jgi:hypothetical protein